MIRTVHFTIVIFAALAAGCDRSTQTDRGPTPPPKNDNQSHSAGDGHDAHAPAIELGNAKIGEFDVRAARDVGELKPRGDAPIDVWLTGGSAKVTAVRFWIGAADARGSVKAKAEIEDPAQPNHWHTHAELPNPIPADSKLWVEITTDGDKTASGSFDLKR